MGAGGAGMGARSRSPRPPIPPLLPAPALGPVPAQRAPRAPGASRRGTGKPAVRPLGQGARLKGGGGRMGVGGRAVESAFRASRAPQRAPEHGATPTRLLPTHCQVRDWYVESFTELRAFPPVTDRSAEERFTTLLRAIYDRHRNAVPVMAMGVAELKKEIGATAGGGRPGGARALHARDAALDDMPEIHQVGVVGGVVAAGERGLAAPTSPFPPRLDPFSSWTASTCPASASASSSASTSRCTSRRGRGSLDSSRRAAPPCASRATRSTTRARCARASMAGRPRWTCTGTPISREEEGRREGRRGGRGACSTRHPPPPPPTPPAVPTSRPTCTTCSSSSSKTRFARSTTALRRPTATRPRCGSSWPRGMKTSRSRCRMRVEGFPGLGCRGFGPISTRRRAPRWPTWRPTATAAMAPPSSPGTGTGCPSRGSTRATLGGICRSGERGEEERGRGASALLFPASHPVSPTLPPLSQIISMENYGTDAYLHLNRLGNVSEPLP